MNRSVDFFLLLCGLCSLSRHCQATILRTLSPMDWISDGNVFSKTHTPSINEELPPSDSEIVHIDPTVWEQGITSSPLNITAFGRTMSLTLTRNDNLLAHNVRVMEILADQEKRVFVTQSQACLYIGRGDGILAALTTCNGNSFEGLIVLPDSTLEMYPVTNIRPQEERASSHSKVPHMMIRRYDDSVTQADARFKEISMQKLLLQNSTLQSNVEAMNPRTESRLTVEIGLFVDQAAVETLSPHFNGDLSQLTDLMLAYLNAVQALFYHPSLGPEQIDLVLVHLEIMSKQPLDLPTHEGERDSLLDSFCAYQRRRNSRYDRDPGHWDMALYVSGLDFFAWSPSNGAKNRATMGLATVAGVCLADYSCVIAEFGPTNAFGRPFPSTGFTSVYVMAHEIGHNLGMSHDSVRNDCPAEGYVMSSTRGTQGETMWSRCSAEVLQTIRSWASCLNDRPQYVRPEYDAMRRFQGAPGLVYTAKRQCELLLLDRDAIPSPHNGLDEICQNLPCRTPHQTGYYFSGPALEGTACGPSKYCRGGECQAGQAPPLSTSQAGGWSEWFVDGGATAAACESGCIYRARGIARRRRTCTNPAPINSDDDRGCEGLSFSLTLCPDHRLCPVHRITAHQYASAKCKAFGRLLPFLSPFGIQGRHETNRLWVACAIFCKRLDAAVFYSPRLDLNDAKHLEPYFPDGTWCHRDDRTGQDYFCLHHHCLPDSFVFSKETSGAALWNDDISWWTGNALPDGKTSSANGQLAEYLSLNAQGLTPLRTSLNESGTNRLYGDEWTVDKSDEG